MAKVYGVTSCVDFVCFNDEQHGLFCGFQDKNRLTKDDLKIICAALDDERLYNISVDRVNFLLYHCICQQKMRGYTEYEGSIPFTHFI